MKIGAVIKGSVMIIALGVVLCVTATASIAGTEKKIPYKPDFLQLVEQGRVREAEIITAPSGMACLRARILGPGGKEAETITTDVAANEEVVKMLRDKGVRVEYKRQMCRPFGRFIPRPFIVVFVIWIVVIIIGLTLAFKLVRAVERIAQNTKKE